jgi:hypothetical protein
MQFESRSRQPWLTAAGLTSDLKLQKRHFAIHATCALPSKVDSAVRATCALPSKAAVMEQLAMFSSHLAQVFGDPFAPVIVAIPPCPVPEWLPILQQ